jgi:hypothetical protein
MPALALVASLCLALLGTVSAARVHVGGKNNVSQKKATSCFPALNFTMPSTVPADSHLSSWWCNATTEHAFLGFSYEVTACRWFCLQLLIHVLCIVPGSKVKADLNSSPNSRISATNSTRATFGFMAPVTAKDSSRFSVRVPALYSC